jgi:transcription initiation factor TFIIB
MDSKVMDNNSNNTSSSSNSNNEPSSLQPYTRAICPLCKNQLIQASEYELVCPNCGYTHENREITIFPHRTFGLDEYMEKANAGEFNPHKINTRIGNVEGFRDSFGKYVDHQTRVVFSRLKKWDNRILDHRHRHIAKAFEEIQPAIAKMGLPEAVVKRALDIYRQVYESGKIKGREIHGLLVASLCLACREANIPRSNKEFAELFLIRPRTLAKYYRLVYRITGINTMPAVEYYVNYISKVANTLQLPEHIKREAIRLYNIAHERRLTLGKHPAGMAATLIYLACKNAGLSITQHQVAEVAGVTEVTVRNRLDDIRKALKWTKQTSHRSAHPSINP